MALFLQLRVRQHFCTAISSVVVSADEALPQLGTFGGRVRIHGNTVAECSVENPRFSPGDAIAHASRGEPCYPANSSEPARGRTARAW